MRRVWIIAVSFISLWLCVAPALAQTPTKKTLYPESRRYSIEVPETWVSGTRSNPNYFFIGESLQVAESQQHLDDYFAGNPVSGQLLVIDFFPLSTLEAFGWKTKDITERQLLMNAFVGMYTEQDLTFSKISGYPAATVDLTGTGYINGGFVYQSLLLVGDVVVNMVTVSGSPQQIMEMDRILGTFQFYTEQPNCSSDFSHRPPLVLENGAFAVPLRQCWLVRTEDVVNSPFNLRQLPRPSQQDTTPSPYYHTIFWDAPLEFMRLVDTAFAEGTRIANRTLIGGMMQIGVYPYEWFSHHPESEQTLQTLFTTIGGRAEAYNIITQPNYTISGRLNSVFDVPDNIGRFLLVANGEHVFLVIIASPSALWSAYATIADAIFERTTFS